MESPRLPRFNRASEIAPMQITESDRKIVQLVHRHRFLRSSHITALVGECSQQVLRRLQLLYHHGYLERPRAQIDYFHQGGSRPMVYGLGRKAAGLLKLESSPTFHELNWTEKNRRIGRLFLEHALLISDVMVSLELACHKSGRVRLILGDGLEMPKATKGQREPFRWSVTLSNRLKLGLIPDQVFALESTDQPPGRNRAYFFLEADRATMPVKRDDLSRTSFLRKLIAYEATWRQGLHRSKFGFQRFRVVTVTSSTQRVESMVAACQNLERGHGLFLFADWHPLAKSDPLAYAWKTARPLETERLLDSFPSPQSPCTISQSMKC